MTSLFIVMLGNSFFNTFVSVRVTSDGYGELMAGLLFSAYYVGMMLGAFHMEKVIARTGHIRAFSIFAAITATSIILQSFTFSPFSWIVFRFMAGASCAGLFIVIESWLLLLSSANTRGSVLSIYMISLYTAQALGQFFLNSVPIASFLAFNLAVVFCTLSIIPVCLMRAAAPSISEIEYINIFYLLRKVPLGFFGNLISGMIISAFYALGPVYAKGVGFSNWQISLIMACTIFGGMALQWPIGAFSDLIQRRKVIIITAIILCIISLCLFFITNTPFWLLLLTLFLFGGFSFTIYPLSITYCCDFFSSAGITSVTCACLLVYGIGCIFGPLLSPLFMITTKPEGLFLYSAILSITLAIYAIWKHHKLPNQPQDTKESYQVMTSVSPKVSEMDPRASDE